MKEALAEIIAMLEEPDATLVGHIIFWVFRYMDEADESLGFHQYLKQEYDSMEENELLR